MPLLKIARIPQDETVLRQRCRPITRVDERMKRLIADMLETMHEAAGVGLAAPQVFVPQRLFVYLDGTEEGALINPEILQAEGTEVGTEGCLSIPRLQGDVERSTRLVVSGLDRNGGRVRIEAADYLARIFQHEIDHLNGVLFTDKADRESLHWLTEEEELERRASGKQRREAMLSGEPAAKPRRVRILRRVTE